jgi:hypothetical protein
MNIISRPQSVSTSPEIKSHGLVEAAGQIVSLLEQGNAISTVALCQIMINIFGGSDAEGIWAWRDAYDACEVAQVLFMRKLDDGERIVGRVIAPSALSGLCRNLGAGEVKTVSAEQAWASLVDGSSVATLAGDLSLRRARVMNDYRIELTGFTDGMRDWLKATGLFSEIIAWKTRFFVPTTEEGPAVLERLIERHRLLELSARG